MQITYIMCHILCGVRNIVYVFIPFTYRLHPFMMHGLPSSARLVFGKSAFGMLPFLMRHVLGVCVLCLGLACQHASSFGFAFSHLVWFCLTRIQRHPRGFTIMFFFGCLVLVCVGLTWVRMRSPELPTSLFCSDAWLILGCSACICKACWLSLEKSCARCLCPLPAPGLSSSIFAWIRFVSLGLSWPR